MKQGRSLHVAVFGGAGYIGAHTVRELLDLGYRVTVFDNLSSGSRANLQPEAGFVLGDLREYGQIHSFLEDLQPDAVLHLVALKAAGESMLAPGRYAETNLGGTLNLLNACDAHGVKLIVFSSSAAVYGSPEYLPIDEKHPVRPENFYGFTKLAAEQYLNWYDRLKQIRFVALRYFNAVGYDPAGRIRERESNPSNLLPIVMEVLAGQRTNMEVYGNDYSTPDGTCLRDYVHVSDLAAAHVLALEYLAEGKPSVTLNLGSNSAVSVLEVIRTAEILADRPVPYRLVGRRLGDPGAVQADATFARQLLGWQPKHSDLATVIRTMLPVYLG